MIWPSIQRSKLHYIFHKIIWLLILSLKMQSDPARIWFHFRSGFHFLMKKNLSFCTMTWNVSNVLTFGPWKIFLCSTKMGEWPPRNIPWQFIVWVLFFVLKLFMFCLNRNICGLFHYGLQLGILFGRARGCQVALNACKGMKVSVHHTPYIQVFHRFFKSNFYELCLIFPKYRYIFL